MMSPRVMRLIHLSLSLDPARFSDVLCEQRFARLRWLEMEVDTDLPQLERDARQLLHSLRFPEYTTTTIMRRPVPAGRLPATSQRKLL
jgi:hypothetical protein